MGFRLLRNTAALSVVLVLAGCAPHEPEIMPVPEPSATPIFASDEDALAAATDAYAKYLKVSDEIALDGGKNPSRIEPFVSAERLQVELEQYRELAKSGNRQEGTTTFDGVTLQQATQDANGEFRITFYACLDQTSSKLIDSSGADITPPGLERRSTFEVTMSDRNAESSSLILEGMERWSGVGVC